MNNKADKKKVVSLDKKAVNVIKRIFSFNKEEIEKPYKKGDSFLIFDSLLNLFIKENKPLSFTEIFDSLSISLKGKISVNLYKRLKKILPELSRKEGEVLNYSNFKKEILIKGKIDKVDKYSLSKGKILI